MMAHGWDLFSLLPQSQILGVSDGKFGPLILKIGKQNWNDHSKGQMEYKRFCIEDAIHINLKKLGEKNYKSNGNRVQTHLVLVLFCQSWVHDYNDNVTQTPWCSGNNMMVIVFQWPKSLRFEVHLQVDICKWSHFDQIEPSDCGILLEQCKTCRELLWDKEFAESASKQDERA